MSFFAACWLFVVAIGASLCLIEAVDRREHDEPSLSYFLAAIALYLLAVLPTIGDF